MNEVGNGLFEQSKEEQSEQHQAQVRELQLSYNECFSTPAGQVVLKNLRALTVGKASLEVYHNDGQNTAIGMAVREGENSLFRKIESLVKNGGSE